MNTTKAPRAPHASNVDPREVQRASTGRANAPALLLGVEDPELRKAIGGAALTFLSQHRDTSVRTAAARAPAFLAAIRDVAYGDTTIGAALFRNPRIGAPVIELKNVLLAFVQAGTVRETLVTRRDELSAAIREIDALLARTP